MSQDSSTSTLGPTPDQKSAVQEYIPLLESRYQSKMPGCTVRFPRPPTCKYFDLSLVEREELEEGLAGQEMARLTVEGRVREILEKRTPVELKDLFKLDQSRKKVILIEGPPGSGKTTLAWHICQEWESGNLFSEFDLVVYVQLRDPAIQAARSITDLFPRRNDQMAKEVVAELEAKDGEGVLFVLDGWDELPGDLPRDSPLRQLIEPALVCPLGKSAVIVTSRPEASAKLHDLASSRVQIVGFLINQITFSEEECEIYPEFATLSLLQAVEGFLDMGLTRTYNFLHLSFQELLAARHISKLPSEIQIEIVHGLLDHRRFAGVFRFYAGITRLRTPGIEGIIREMVQRFMQDRIYVSFSCSKKNISENKLITS